LNFDPAGQRLFCSMIYGSSARTDDGGKTWTKSKTSHLDFGSVDWEDSGRRVLALRHESGGMLTTSEDGGATWTDLGKGFRGLGVLDRKTFVATKEKEKGIFRSTDSGATWSLVASNAPIAAVPMVYKGDVYWPGGRSLWISRDKGMTWTESAVPSEILFGPFFGKKAGHFVVVGRTGFQETKDGGKTWELAAPLPTGFGISRVGPNYAWDPNADIFYASTMTKPTFRWKR
ncbi:MAG: hypothetical protein QOF48_3673, partial [Verrucomicrobiota bacterium]